MRPQVSLALRNEVMQLVSLYRPQEGFRLRWPSLAGRFEHVILAVQHFHLQTRQLEFGSESQFASNFRDDGPDREWLPVLVQVPDLQNGKASYEYLLIRAKNSNA
jgi:hypothetical protein